MNVGSCDACGAFTHDYDSPLCGACIQRAVATVPGWRPLEPVREWHLYCSGCDRSWVWHGEVPPDGTQVDVPCSCKGDVRWQAMATRGPVAAARESWMKKQRGG